MCAGNYDPAQTSALCSPLHLINFVWLSIHLTLLLLCLHIHLSQKTTKWWLSFSHVGDHDCVNSFFQHFNILLLLQCSFSNLPLLEGCGPENGVHCVVFFFSVNCEWKLIQCDRKLLIFCAFQPDTYNFSKRAGFWLRGVQPVPHMMPPTSLARQPVWNLVTNCKEVCSVASTSHW